jgi:hypothetical protein
MALVNISYLGKVNQVILQNYILHKHLKIEASSGVDTECAIFTFYLDMGILGIQGNQGTVFNSGKCLVQINGNAPFNWSGAKSGPDRLGSGIYGKK